MGKKFALITGATGGIGNAISLRMLDDNFNLILVSRNIEKLNIKKDSLLKLHPQKLILIYQCNVGNYNEVLNLFNKIKTEIGIKNLNVLINCAGISGGGITSEIDPNIWNDVINTNLNGAFYVTKEALKHELITAGGRIINIASTGGKQGVIHGAPYCASKHGLIGFTKALGLELARNNSGITVNAICPGFVETEMAERVREHYSKISGAAIEETKKGIEARVPIGRYILPSEVANMVAYVASEYSQAITAQALNICGGLGNY